MTALGIIPARGGSKRVPGKNLRLLGGRPLVAWSIQAALAARTVDRVVVSSDDARVLKLARAFDESLCVERPAELSTDTAPAIAYVVHALEVLEGAGEGPYDTTVILQPSSPLTLPEDIDGTVRLLRDTGGDSAVSVVRVEHAVHPAKLKVMDGDRLLPFLEEERGRMAAHELPPVFVRNCAVYASARRTIDAGDIIGEDSRGYEMPRERSIDINDEMDLLFAEFLVERMERAANG